MRELPPFEDFYLVANQYPLLTEKISETDVKQIPEGHDDHRGYRYRDPFVSDETVEQDAPEFLRIIFIIEGWNVQEARGESE